MKRPNGGFVLVLLAASLAACTPAPPLYWYKTGATQQDFARDDYQCRRENTVTGSDTTYTPPNIFSPYGSATTTPTVEVNADLFARCMNARGWYLQPAATHAPPECDPGYFYDRAKSLCVPTTAKKRDLKNQPECAWGEYWHSVKKQCVKIGTD